MKFKPTLWEPIAWLLAALNLASLRFPIPAEGWHATTHVGLAIVFALWAQHLMRLGKASVPDSPVAERLRELEARLADFDKLPDVEARVAELEERLDFTERALLEVRSRAPLPPKA